MGGRNVVDDSLLFFHIPPALQDAQEDDDVVQLQYVLLSRGDAVYLQRLQPAPNPSALNLQVDISDSACRKLRLEVCGPPVLLSVPDVIFHSIQAFGDFVKAATLRTADTV